MVSSHAAKKLQFGFWVSNHTEGRIGLGRHFPQTSFKGWDSHYPDNGWMRRTMAFAERTFHPFGKGQNFI